MSKREFLKFLSLGGCATVSDPGLSSFRDASEVPPCPANASGGALPNCGKADRRSRKLCEA